MIIMLNGAPGCGKDTAADYLFEKYRVKKTKMAAVLKERLFALHKIGNTPSNHKFYFEENKDRPLGEFYNRTPRQCLIQLSEQYYKPLFGKDIFTKLWIEKYVGSDPRDYRICSISDIGFQEEVNCLQKLKFVKFTLIQIYRDGCSFDNDSRNYVTSDVVTPLLNNGTKLELYARLDRIMRKIGLIAVE
jgi:hypothetical protein